MSSRRRIGWSWILPATVLVLAGPTALAGDDPPATKARAATKSPGEGPSPAPSSSAAAPPATGAAGSKKAAAKAASKFPRVVKSDRQWRSMLDANRYLVARRKATEPAFTGAYWDRHDDGVYVCVCCGTPMFDSQAKFESGTGWPSYWRAIDPKFVKTRSDLSNGEARTEVTCRVCDAHLGHVFDDGPRPTGLRFCINSASLDFVPRMDVPTHLERWRKGVGLEPAAEAGSEKPGAGSKDAGGESPLPSG